MTTVKTGNQDVVQGVRELEQNLNIPEKGKLHLIYSVLIDTINLSISMSLTV